MTDLPSSDAASARDDDSAELIRRARSGEQEALTRLIESWRTYLLYIASDSLEDELHPKLGASDIVQSACLEIHKHFANFHGDSVAEWKSWLRQMIVRDVQDARRRYRGTARRNLDRERPIAADSVLQMQLSDDQLTPRAASIAAEETQTLRQALQRLPAEYREVIKLRNWDELPFSRIGELLNRSEDAARKLWSRAVARLETELDRIINEPPS